VHTKLLRLAALAVALSGPAAAQVAILQIHVLEGEGAVHPPGARISRPLVVEITDETGKPVEGAAVSFHLPDDGPTGLFFNGLRTEVSLTDPAGRAAVHGLVLNRVAGRFQIRVVASKEQARAGIFSFQYIAGSNNSAAPVAESKQPASPRAAAPSHPAASHGGGAKWWIVAAVLAGGAAAGVLGAGRSGNNTPPAAAVPAPPPLSIGLPSSTVVKP
jgi:hypothetical protein